MNSTAARIIILSQVLVFCASAPLCANDWPQFRGPRRDGIVPGITLSAEWPERLAVRWQKALGIGYSAQAALGFTT